jgi:hypothetical protein
VKRRLYTITVAGVPNSVNRGGGGVRASHWGTAYKEKKHWQQVFMAEFMVKGIPRKMHACNVDVTLRFRGRYHRDLENFRHPVSKPLADALVAGDWLEDDTSDYFTIIGFDMEEGCVLHGPWRDNKDVKGEMVIKLDALYTQGRTP